MKQCCSLHNTASLNSADHSSGGPGKRAVKRLWWCGGVFHYIPSCGDLHSIVQFLFTMHSLVQAPLTIM